MNKYEKAIEILNKYNQPKLKKELEKNKNEQLINQILSIDFEQIELIKIEIGKENTFSNDVIEKIHYTDPSKISENVLQNYKEIGENIISAGHYAVVTMAGGQRNKTWLQWSKRNFFNRCKT